MGYYIDSNSRGCSLGNFDKANKLILDGGTKVDGDENTSPPFQENLICAADNGTFEAALYIYSQGEYDYITKHKDERKKTWLTHPLAKKLSGYEK